MMGKWIGAMMIVAGCAGIGLSLAANEKRRAFYLRLLLQKLERMEQELSSHILALPNLFAVVKSEDPLGMLFAAMARLLEEKAYPSAQDCMEAALLEQSGIPVDVKDILRRLGSGLGLLDLDGQRRQLQIVIEECRRSLDTLMDGQALRLKNYCTLSLCCGAALAVLLI